MAFVAGYVAFKCRHIDASLGVPMDSASPAVLASVPSSWLQAVSRGHLYVPSAKWMAVVEAFEVNFGQLMGETASKEPGIVRQLVELIRVKDPQLDQRVAKKLASTRLHFRLRKLNRARLVSRAQRCAAKKVMHHVISSR